jgi:hypothetical protein
MGTIFDRDYEPPESEPADTAHSVVKGVFSLIPGLPELFNLLITPPLERRRAEWMQDVAAVLRRLEADRGVRLEDLRDNPVFIDAVLSASQAAIRTSQEEKRRALRNAIANAALPDAPDVMRQQMFIGLIDRFTGWHLRVLRLFQDPKAVLGDDRREGMGSLRGVVARAYPEMNEQGELLDLVWQDLQGAGLHRSGPLGATMTASGTMVKRTSDLGDEFIRFISEP